jgi:mannonate dehydratase
MDAKSPLEGLEMDRYPLRVVPGYYASRPGIQLGTQLPPDCSEEDMQFAQQLGVEWVATWLRTREENTLENYIALRKKFESHGLKVWKILNYRALNIPEITLNLPGRDERIAEYLDYIRALGKAGIHYATYAHQASGVWRSEPEPVRGGAMHHALRLDKNPAGHWVTKMQGELTHGVVS